MRRIIPEVLGPTPDGQGAVMLLPGDHMHSSTLKNSSSKQLNRLHITRKDGKVDSMILSSEPEFHDRDSYASKL